MDDTERAISNQSIDGNDGDESFSLSDIRELVREEVHRFIEVRGDDEDPTLEDVWVAGQPLGKIIEKNRKTAVEADKKAEKAVSGDATPGVEADKTDSSDDDITPMERLLRGEDDDWYASSVTESVERAKELYRHFGEWSSSAKKGQVLKTSGGKRGTATLKTLLNTVLDGPELSWKQVYRACQKLEEWTKGAIQFKDHSRHGKMLVMDGRVSSVGTT